jgi:hypothetical protein
VYFHPGRPCDKCAVSNISRERQLGSYVGCWCRTACDGGHRMSRTNNDRAFADYPLTRSGEGMSPILGPTAQLRIGYDLRTMYDDVVQEPLPAPFLDLLARLDGNDERPSPLEADIG